MILNESRPVRFPLQHTLGRIFRNPALWLLCLVVIQYVALSGVYRPENTDDAFTLSFLYNFHHRGVEIDDVFGNAFQLERQNGVTLFGKLQAFVYGPILDVFGWTRGAAHWISVLFIAATAICWALTAKKATRDSALAVVFGLLLVWTEPMFAAANQARPDAMTLFFSSLALCALVYERPLLGGICSIAAVETHPMGAMAILYLASWIAVRAYESSWRKNLRGVLFKVLAGMVIGVLGYVALHHRHLGELIPQLTLNSKSFQGAFLFSFFFRTEFFRHIPELILFLSAPAIIFFSKKKAVDQLLVTLLLSGAIALFLFRRDNFQYAVYLYPLFVYLLLCAFKSWNRIWIPVALYLVLLAPQYAYVYAKNHSTRIEEYVQAVTQTVPRDELPVVGTPNAWFAFHERTFYAIEYRNEWLFERDFQEFYLVGTPYDSIPNVSSVYERFRSTYSCRVISRPTAFGRSFPIEYCVSSHQ